VIPRKLSRVALGALAAWALVYAFADAKTPPVGAVDEKRVVNVATVDGAIQPITAEYIVHSIDRAERDHCEALVIRLDTPGGLDTSMRQIVKRILVSEVPVIVYVAPAGSRAASAGTFIAYAAHVSAMAPGTAIGAATPVSLGGGGMDSTMAHKVQNDAVSYIRSLAAQRGRNADWGEKAVRAGGSLPEDEALKMDVVDYVARDLDELLDKVDGRTVTVAGATRTLHTRGAAQVFLPPSLRQHLLGRIVDPNIAYILFILGFYGIIFELSNPGAILPGIIGGISILLALLAFQALPVNMTGVFLILFAMLLFLVEVKVHSHGLLSGGGVIALVLGSLLLVSGGQGQVRLSLSVILTVTVATVLFFAFVIGAGYRALQRKPVTGHEGLVGERGVALTAFTSRTGRIFVHGENWAAEADERIEKGEPVIVDQVDGMRLRVHRA